MLRITAGEFKGRLIQAPAHQETRPTQAKLRQALFNSIQAYTPEARVLDLFSGSGALGFEALSRGAENVVFVEENASVAKWIEKNAKTLGVQSRTQILIGSVEKLVKKLTKQGPFDLILADPPYGKGWEIKLLQAFSWSELLSDEGVFCLEWSNERGETRELPEEVPFLVKVREKHYGDSMLTTYTRTTLERAVE